jgi:hypothetical protein
MSKLTADLVEFKRRGAAIGNADERVGNRVQLEDSNGNPLTAVPIIAGIGDVTVGIDQTTPGTTNRVQAGATKIITGTFTRPNDTTAYAANDGVTNATSSPSPITFANAVQGAGLGAVLRTAIMRKSTTAITNATFRLYLFDITPTVVPNDNAAYSLAIADGANLIGTIDFSLVAGSDFAWGVGTLSPDVQPFVVAVGTSIFGIAQVLAAYAPGAQEVFTFELGDFQD